MNNYELNALVGKVEKQEVIQGVWGGYGTLIRQWLVESEHPSVVNKQIRFPQQSQHPKGWNTSTSHKRKLQSFCVEVNWYRDYSQSYDQRCLSPLGLVTHYTPEMIDLVMTDLSNIGLPVVVTESGWRHWRLVLSWLANFHAKHLNANAVGLWSIGSYWHFATRQDEYQAMECGDLKEKAADLDKILNKARYQTIIHGDAKLANFCFSRNHDKVGAVDFQYVGKGCGIKDVMLFISSSIPLDMVETIEEELLRHYFDALSEALSFYQPSSDFKAIETEWRSLYCIAWADFVRFLKGWSPEHWKICAYSQTMTTCALKRLD